LNDKEENVLDDTTDGGKNVLIAKTLKINKNKSFSSVNIK
jgi:hypothetical protein